MKSLNCEQGVFSLFCLIFQKSMSF
jgi:hypothetical protein